MVKQSETIHTSLKTWRMLFWQYGTIPDPLTQTQTTTFALKEKLVGVGIRENWPRILKNSQSSSTSSSVRFYIASIYRSEQKSATVFLSPWWYTESKRGLQCFDLAACHQGDALKPANCRTGNFPSCWCFQQWS